MSHPLLKAFQFRAGPPRRSGRPRLQMVQVPIKVVSKERLFRKYAQDLKFPGYFGGNWDAFEECLRDLSWLKMPLCVKVWHAGCPFLNQPAELMTYCEILNDLATIPTDHGIEYEIQFRREDRDALSRALESLA